jgi:hypothetical protein
MTPPLTPGRRSHLRMKVRRSVIMKDDISMDVGQKEYGY